MQPPGGHTARGLQYVKKLKEYVVIASQSADWRGNPPDRSKSHWFRI